MTKIKNFLKRLRFELYFDIYVIRINTIVLTRPVGRLVFDICRLQVSIIGKTILEFDLYKTERW